MAGRSTTSPEEKARKQASQRLRQYALRREKAALRRTVSIAPAVPKTRRTYGCRYGEWSRFVPVELKANLECRHRVLAWGRSSSARGRALYEACRLDPLLWANLFAWVHEPRESRGVRVLPFIAWDFQEEVLRELFSIAGREDRIIEKSRDMGATWMCLLLVAHGFLFGKWQTYLLTSAKQDDVDRSGNPDTMFWKLDFLLRLQPAFLRRGYDPDHHRRALHMEHPVTRGVVDGTSTTADAGRGGRRFMVVADEFASVADGWDMATALQSVTRCRIFNSTPGVTGLDAFYGLIRRGHIKRITLHWSRHPLKNAGVYTDEHGLLRSPWYDAEEARATDLERFHREQDLQYVKSAGAAFSALVVERCKREDAVVPLGRYDLTGVDGMNPRLEVREGGTVSVWVPLLWGRAPLNGEYVIGVDVSGGTGASNSTMSVSEVLTGSKVAEWATPEMGAADWARCAAALGRVFTGSTGEALIIFEGNGDVGATFAKTIRELGYPRLYYRPMPNGKQATRPGWFSTAETKGALLREYADALAQRRWVNRSVRALEETQLYVFTGPGRIEHVGGAASAKERGRMGFGGHGDMVIADALACHVSRLPDPMERRRREEEGKEPRHGSIEWLDRMHRELQPATESDW